MSLPRPKYINIAMQSGAAPTAPPMASARPPNASSQPPTPAGPSGPPQHLSEGPSPPPPGPTKPTYSKRGKITIVACVNCRRRKTKCDGQRPICSQCRARDGTICHYDMNEEQRRLTYLRENVETLADEKGALESLITNLKISSEAEAIEILRRLREGTDAHTLAQSVQAGRALAQVSRPGEGSASSPGRPDIFEQLVVIIAQAPPPELDEVIRRIRLQEDAASIVSAASNGTLLQPLDSSGLYSASKDLEFSLTQAGADSSPHIDAQLASRTENSAFSMANPAAQGVKSSNWIGPPSDSADNAIALYFSWQHCFFQSLPQKLFLQDMSNHGTKYCSKMLVNAICAMGCWLGPWPSLPSKATRPIELSDHFLHEATNDLNLDPPSIPTVAALHIMACVEGNQGRMSQAWELTGRSARMALDLGLHLRNDRSTIDADEKLARTHAFWACFVADQVISFTLGRVPMIPITAITVELPALNQEDDDAPWEPYGDGAKTKVPGGRATTFYEVVSLSKILNSTLHLFFAPTQPLKGPLVLDEYSKYEKWYNRLPRIVKLTADATPHVLGLHMYYHAAVLLLFRPFLKARFTGSSISADEICKSSAAAICDIFDQHYRMYASIGIYTLQLHCLLAACTIHLVHMPDDSSARYLNSAILHFQDLKSSMGWAEQSLKILQELAQRWSVVLPPSLETSLYQDSNTTSLHDVALDPTVPSKRSAFTSASSTPSSNRKKRKLSPSAAAAAGEDDLLLADASNPSNGEAAGPASRPTVPMATGEFGSSTASGLLFSPIPYQTVPLLAPTHTSSSMDGPEPADLSAEEFDGITFESSFGAGSIDPAIRWDDD